MAQALALYKKKDYEIDTRSKEDIDWQLSNMGPKRLFAKDVISKQHGIAIARVLNNNFINKAVKARDLAYALKVYNPSKSQLQELERYMTFASASIENNIASLKPDLNRLENVLKKAGEPVGNIRKWLDQKSMDWSKYGVEYVDNIGFPGYCEGCYELAFVNLGACRKGLLYIPEKEKILPLEYNSYLTLVPLKGAWYYFKTY